MKWLRSLREGLSKTRETFLGNLTSLLKKSEITQEVWDDLEEILLQSDAGVATTQEILSLLKEEVRAHRVKETSALLDLLKKEIKVFLGNSSSLTLSPTPPTVMLIVGVNGTGKTTSIAKLGHYFASHGKKVLVAAADTFRAAAIDQLEIWSEKAGLDLIKHREGSDPAAVVFDAVKASVARGGDLLLVDTAGRLHTKSNLMEELKKIKRVMTGILPQAPHEVLLVLDATNGQNALIQARTFKEAVNLTGVILTKLDGTAKGGIVLAIVRELGVPVRFVGIGEGLEDLRPFSPAEFASAILE